MIRIRRAADAAASLAGKGFPALLDLHTGREGTPDTCSYATHVSCADRPTAGPAHPKHV